MSSRGARTGTVHESIYQLVRFFPKKDISELSNSAKDEFGKKFMNSIGGQNNKGKKHTKQQNEAQSKRMKGHAPRGSWDSEAQNRLRVPGTIYASPVNSVYALPHRVAPTVFGTVYSFCL